MGAALAAMGGAKLDPPTVVWVHSSMGVQFGLDVPRLAKDLLLGGIQLLQVDGTDKAMALVTSLGPSVRCVVQNWRRSQNDSGRQLIEQLQRHCGVDRRHIPVLVLAESVLTDQKRQRQIAEMGEAAAVVDPRTSEGYRSLVKWIVQHCIGIEKSALCVRHAEAEHNVNHDWSIPDPALTENGVLQAKQLAQQRLVEEIGAEVFIVSPLRRTLQTTLLGFPHVQLPLLCHPHLQETGEVPCDSGSDKAQLKQWFPGLCAAFEGLDDDWHVKRGINREARVNERLARFVGWLRQRREKRIVIVSHGNLLGEMLGLHCEQPSWAGTEGSRGFKNCECRKYWLLSSGSWLAVPSAL